ncbi:MAG: hypothetical protein U1C04_18925 [Hydrogenophaga sp.]|uniref:hypothetical protein n=1 Tax=Hydrogenophaga sp. TaxID=1904254 RepID=UPI002ABC7080|nr:hypothetical protein [Hydrogenophaga sp.]MDZ4282825.1 hypothetical protein [Hydrogenophaga sp.]
MSLSLAARRARLVAFRTVLDLAGAGSLHLFGGVIVASPETPPDGVALVIVPLAEVSCEVDPVQAEMTLVPAQGFASSSGLITWARFMDANGDAVYDTTAGPPGSGAQVIVTDGADPPTANVFVGGEVNVTATFSEP